MPVKPRRFATNTSLSVFFYIVHTSSSSIQVNFTLAFSLQRPINKAWETSQTYLPTLYCTVHVPTNYVEAENLFDGPQLKRGPAMLV